MSTPIHRIVNTQTNEVVEIEFTDKEVAAYAVEAKAEQAVVDAKAQAKLEILERLGITAEEAALLLA